MTITTHKSQLDVRAAGKTYHLDFRQAFRFGYTLLRTRKYEDAVRVFEALARLGGSDPLPAIMLAYCKAGMKDFETSNTLLCAAFSDEGKGKAEQLQAVFVYLSVGMWADGIDELTKMVRQYPDLPIICLLLGDVLVSQRKRTKAILCWRLAIARDHDDGAVAAVARRSISSQVKPPTKT
jgi:tetratricopeptide (TPR) repeat protein